MKNYVTPEMRITEFEAEDIITASGIMDTDSDIITPEVE